VPTWPVVPEPLRCTSFSIQDPIYEYAVDQGYRLRRSRSSRSRRGYTLTYLEDADTMFIITDFIERVIRGNALSFDWVYPYGSAILSINTSTPNRVNLTHRHGMQTGQGAEIVGTATHDGLYIVTRFTDTTLQLNGTSGGVGEGSMGTLAIRFARMVCKFSADTMPAPQIFSAFGPYRDDTGLGSLTFQIMEEFA